MSSANGSPDNADAKKTTRGSRSQLSMPQPGEPIPAQPPPEQINAPASPQLAGRTLGQYRILEKIGQGGMGTVFKAFDTMLERTVALKVLFSGVLDDAKHSERFLREARSLARLTHPNLVHVYNVGLENDCYYFAMELVEGETLSAAIRRRRRIPIEELLPYLGQILSALHYVHLQGVTHRDIKSGNMMLSGRHAVLMDFGLAKDENFTGMTSVGAIVGTPDYMSPECAEGLTAGPPTDIYSFGVVMYEALSGAVPFAGRSALSIIRQHMDIPPPPIEASLPNIEPILASIVHKCLAKKPLDRYPNCAALAADLLRMQNTPELAALAQEQLNATERTSPRGSLAGPNASGGSDADSQIGAEATLLDTRGGRRPAPSGDVDATLAGGSAHSPHLSAAGTIVDPENTIVLPAQPAKPWRAGLWIAAGFFGVFFVAFLLGRVMKGPKQALPPAAPIQMAQLHKADGSTQEIRWIEFKAGDPDPSKWYYVIELKQPDGSWKRSTILHQDFARTGDTLELLPATGAAPKP